MSQLTQTLKVETTRLEKGEVAIIDDVAYEIIAVERLMHYSVYTATELTAAASDVQKNIRNLQPDNNELYQIEFIGIDGAARIRVEYPLGTTRNTPHQLAEIFDQVTAPVGGYAFGKGRMYMWCVPSRYPVLRATNPLTAAIVTVVYFHGWKYRTRIITSTEVESKRALGIRVLEADSYYPSS